MTPGEKCLTVLMSGLTGLCVYLARRTNPMSSPSSLRPSMSPIPTSDTSTDSMMTTMREMLREQAEETRKLVTGLVYPQASPPQTSQPVTEPTSNEKLIAYDYDSTPLSTGIEAVLQREMEEDALQASLRERAGLQGRIRELQDQQMEMETQEVESSNGPWHHQSVSDGERPK